MTNPDSPFNRLVKYKHVVPRYVLPSKGTQQFEFPVQALSRNKPAAFVAIEADFFSDALRLAVEWATQYSTTQHVPVYPRVKYRGKHRMVKKVSPGAVPHTAYVENDTHAAWVPLGVLSV